MDSVLLALSNLINAYIGKDKIEWTNVKAMQFLGYIYDNANIYLKRKYDKYKEFLNER